MIALVRFYVHMCRREVVKQILEPSKIILIVLLLANSSLISSASDFWDVVCEASRVEICKLM